MMLRYLPPPPPLCWSLARTFSMLSPSVGFKILGSIVIADDRSGRDTDFRISQAWRAFFVHHSIFFNHQVDPLERIHALNVFVRPVLTYGAQLWTPTKAEIARLETRQLQMCRKIVNFSKNRRATYVEDVVRVSERARRIIAKLGHDTWDSIALSSIHQWSGHVARYAAYSPHRLSLQLLSWKNWAYVDYIKKLNSDGRHLGRGHRRKAWRYETHLYEHYNAQFPFQDWRMCAMNSTTWKQNETHFVKSRTYTRAWL